MTVMTLKTIVLNWYSGNHGILVTISDAIDVIFIMPTIGIDNTGIVGRDAQVLWHDDQEWPTVCASDN